MKQRIINNKKEAIGLFASIIYYLSLALYKLNATSIWQDEAMEFYTSISTKGAIRGVTTYETWYERIAHIQQQPPLYNWVMNLWLRVNTGEFWYRLSSVLMGLVAIIGLYLVIRTLCNYKYAIVSVVSFSSIYIVMYYVKEASEYIMLMMFLIWTIYLYLHMLEKITVKRLLLFVLCCIVTIYTHYSAAFVMIPLAFSVLYHLYKENDTKLLKISIFSYLIAGITAGVPLLLLFIKPQMKNEISTLGVDKAIEITGNNIILDFFDSIMWVFRWCISDYDRDWKLFTPIAWVSSIAIIILGIIVFKKTKRKNVRYLIGCNIGIYMIYYITTTLNIYAYGWFGNRYNIFILPIWFITILVILFETITLINKKMYLLHIGLVVCAFLFACYGVKRINDHWGKSDVRTIVTMWEEEKLYEIPTFVNFHQRYAFMYYFSNAKTRNETWWNNLVTNLNLNSLSYTEEEWITYLEQEVYKEGIPDKLYIVSGQKDTIILALESYGYIATPVIDSTAKLYLLEK
ncbi:MAG: glycosyltransferase family 39 protein [Lachnospiraceae bacterium]